MTIREFAVRTVASEPPAQGVYLRCVTDRQAPADPPQSCLPGYENSIHGCFFPPAFAAGRGRDVMLDYDYDVRTEPYRGLAEVTFTLAEDELYDLPVMAVSTRDVDASYVITVKLTVNGRQISQTLDNGGEPFRVLWQPHGVGFYPPSYLWYQGRSERLEWVPGG